MLKIKIRKYESIETALRRFKRFCERSGKLSKARMNLYYEKPSIKKKKIRLLYKKRIKKKNINNKKKKKMY